MKIKEFETDVFISEYDDGEHSDPVFDVDCVHSRTEFGGLRLGKGLEERLYQLFGEGAIITIKATLVGKFGEDED